MKFVTLTRIVAVCLLTVPALGLAQVIDLRGYWRFRIGDDEKWAMQYYNDTSWGKIKVPSAWEDQGFNGYDGFAWYRTNFDGSVLRKSETYVLKLGYIDDADEVYLNGKLIGFSGKLPPYFKTAYNNERHYIIPAYLLNFTGGNTIAVRVFDAMHGGGIVDGDIGIYTQTKSNRLHVDLQGVWLFATSRTGKPVEREKDWSKIMVPAPWEHQGYFKYDGYAWYKKSFTLPDNIGWEPLVLVLGKIDDFDEVYLNGEFIGSTNDKKSYGSSSSYQQTRVYDIPEKALRRDGENQIEVLVYDMGNIGGIYEGMVGITTKSNYQRYFR